MNGGDALKHCRTLIEAESEASKDTKEAQAHLDQNVLAGYATVAARVCRVLICRG